jgi:hypothetical protein
VVDPTLSYRHVYTEPVRRHPAPKLFPLQAEWDTGTEPGPSKLRANKDYLTGTGPTSAPPDDDAGPPPF